MWVFGYGSLMTDGWEKGFDCTQRVTAELKGYRRAFNKASVTNWGTRDCPCPTLNLVPEASANSLGIAFEFTEVRRGEVEAYLAKREGKNFKLSNLEVIADGSGAVQALVPLYAGKNIIQSHDMRTAIELACHAKGSSGKCSDYILNISEQLKMLGINDPAVTEMREILCKAPSG
ncbi:gamma-glutamylcyclotransferase [Halopseudomonas pelagia]|uniref:glutathione-specific gamma-glutamylcyclotransferase n=1 Tax=Halopseudomonas pelagia TaxID=553151 RepID=A0AA91TZY4_9GAMM|nr:gamma-glutamylcyclotransferase [Halopseudomonas pelagia]PCC97912.1 cation transporter [Halopseudomonas pelagia]QFY56177.1 cation transporter [Halopseudomonas pelagia]